MGLPEPRLLYLEENGMVLVRSLGKGQNSRLMRASIDSLLGGRWCFLSYMDGLMMFVEDFKQNSRYCGLSFFFFGGGG